MRNASVGWLESVISDNKEMLGKPQSPYGVDLIIIDANIYATIGVGIADYTHRIIKQTCLVCTDIYVSYM